MVKKSASPAKKVAGPVAKQPTRAGAPASKAAPSTAAPPTKSPPPTATATTAAKTPAKAAAPAAPAASTPKDAVKDPAPAKKAAAKAAAQTIPVAPAVPAAEPVRRIVAAKKAAVAPAPSFTIPPVKGETKDGIKYTKDFDAKFLTTQHKLLIEARESLTGQALRLEDEANSLIDEEMGDVQFDDESGEGDTMVVERERDLFLSARARQDIEEIDGALKRLEIGSYGYSVVSFKPIPRERLEAIPWATELTEEKVGGIGRR